MTPYRGIGGNVALRDASLLGRNLAAAHRGDTPLLQAIHEYESAMLDYGFRAVRNSLQAALQAHAEGALAFSLGNLFFRMVNALPPLKARMMRGDADD
jgi:2-polyprenyl-6-methoxyphenol hydroxylase-like FAD-dependent oxidoreductase